MINKKVLKGFLSLFLILLIILSFAFSTVVFAEDESSFTSGIIESNEVAEAGASQYYFWGQNNNGPNFGSMTKATGMFSYDSSIGYYYDLDKSDFQSGDYCFVISTVSNSGSAAASNQAIKLVAQSGNYFLQYGNYSSYTCFHIWNDRKDPIRISFSSTSSAVTAAKGGTTPTTPTTTPTSPTTKPTSPTTTPTSPTTKPTSPTIAPGIKKYVYCENEAGWTTVNAYLWNSASDQNAGWPGKKMDNLGGNIWRYELPKDYANIIFNDGNTQTGDMTYPGDGYIFNNKTNVWTIYDVSPLQVTTYTTDLVSPQYDGTEITLSAGATGVGSVQYKFSVENSSGVKTVLKEFSTKTTCKWTPNTTGAYKLIFDFKDTANNTNQRTIEYQINSSKTVAEPIIKSISPSSGQIVKGEKCNVSVSAGGGNVGTKLLFYKYTVIDQTGKVANVPYYTKKNTYSFTPNSLGTYQVVVSCQASDNSEAVRQSNLQSVSEKTDDDDLQINSFTCTGATLVGNTVTISASASGGTAPYTYKFTAGGKVIQNYSSKNSASLSLDKEGDLLVRVDVTDSKNKTIYSEMTLNVKKSGYPDQRTLKGDADRSGKVDVSDATCIQKFAAKLLDAGQINQANADVDGSGVVDVLDATIIQKHIAGIEVDW